MNKITIYIGWIWLTLSQAQSVSLVTIEGTPCKGDLRYFCLTDRQACDWLAVSKSGRLGSDGYHNRCTIGLIKSSCYVNTMTILPPKKLNQWLRHNNAVNNNHYDIIMHNIARSSHYIFHISRQGTSWNNSNECAKVIQCVYCLCSAHRTLFSARALFKTMIAVNKPRTSSRKCLRKDGKNREKSGEINFKNVTEFNTRLAASSLFTVQLRPLGKVSDL